MLIKTGSRSIANAKLLVLLVFCMLSFVSYAQVAGSNTLNTQENFATIKVEAVKNQSAGEKAEVQAALENFISSKSQKKLVVTDGSSEIIYELEIEAGAVVVTKTEKLRSDTAVSFGEIEQAPVFPGCENLQSSAEQKKCTVEKTIRHVNTNFNLDIANQTSLQGIQKIYVRFKIDEAGNVADIQTRAPAPELAAEAKRVVQMLPQMTPGTHNGKPVSVLYSLPIQLNINADKMKDGQ